jgi:hypothetical protein
MTAAREREHDQQALRIVASGERSIPVTRVGVALSQSRIDRIVSATGNQEQTARGGNGVTASIHLRTLPRVAGVESRGSWILADNFNVFLQPRL